MNPYYLYWVLLGPGDFAERLEFCSWLNARYHLRRYISFTDETQLNRDRLHNTVPTCGQMGLLTVPWKVTCSSGWSGGRSFHLPRPSYRRFPREELPQILKDAILNKWGRMNSEWRSTSSFSCAVRRFLNDRFAVRCIGRGVPHNWPGRSLDLRLLDFSLWGWMKEMIHCVKIWTRGGLFGRILDGQTESERQQQL